MELEKVGKEERLKSQLLETEEIEIRKEIFCAWNKISPSPLSLDSTTSTTNRDAAPPTATSA